MFLKNLINWTIDNNLIIIIFIVVLITTLIIRLFTIWNLNNKNTNINFIKKQIIKFLNFEKISFIIYAFLYFWLFSLFYILFFWNENEIILLAIILWLNLTIFIEINIRKNIYFKSKVKHIFKKLNYSKIFDFDEELNYEPISLIKYNKHTNQIFLISKTSWIVIEKEDYLKKDLINTL